MSCRAQRAAPMSGGPKPARQAVSETRKALRAAKARRGSLMARYDFQATRQGPASWRRRMAIARPIDRDVHGVGKDRRLTISCPGRPKGDPGPSANLRRLRSAAPGSRVSLRSPGTRTLASLGVHLDHHAFRKNLLDLGVAMRDALLVHVAQELLEGRAVLLDPERERIAAERVAHAACIDRQPRQRIARHRLLEHARM